MMLLMAYTGKGIEEALEILRSQGHEVSEASMLLGIATSMPAIQ
jgi:hypothetical protein